MKKQSNDRNAPTRRVTNRIVDAVARAAWATPLESLEHRQHMDAAAVQSTPFALDFNSDINDSVKDKNGKGTGFTRVQDNAAHNAYQPDKIELDTAAGTLKITTVGSALYGSSGGTDNAQTNALETQFNGNQKGFTIETRLIGPLSNLNDRYEQAGIYFGADQDNYIKLAAMRNWNGQYLGFEDEYSNGTGGVTTTRNGTNAQTNIGSFASINTLDLRIVGDASTGVVSAYWRVNSDNGAFSQVGFSITIAADKRATFFSATSRAGIIAAHKNDIGPITATFDSFKITGGTPVIVQPTVTAISGVSSGATNVRRDPTITATVTFAAGGSTSIKASTLNSTTVRLINADTQTTVAASLSIGSGGNTIVVTPSGLLDPATQYTLQITSGVTDGNGQAFVPYSVGFTTTANNSAPTLGVSKSTFFFSDVSGNGTTSGQQTVRLTNSGNAPLVIESGGLTITGTNPTDFQLVGLPSGTITVKAGAYLDVAIVMKAAGVGLRYATLNVASNDSAGASKQIALRGLGTAGEGGSLEPSLQRVLDLYQLGINTGDNTPDVSNDFPATVVGPEEVAIQRLKKAGSGNVTIELLGNFANSVSPSSIFGYYSAGSPQGRTKLFQVDKAYAQTVTPVINGTSTFNPTGDFGIYGEFPAFAGRVVTSEKQFNTWDSNVARQQKVRFWALKDANGNVVPNAYVFAFEEYGVEFDQNDLIGIIRNVQPSLNGAEIGVQNLDGVPFDDRLVFSRIRNTQASDPANFYIPNTFHDTATVRITNSGDQDLVVSNVTVTNLGTAVLNTDFTITSGGGSFTLAPGATRDITVKFVFDRTGLGNEVRTASLRLESNDVDESVKNLTLAGLWQSYSENAPSGVSQEPTAATVLQAFGYNVNVGTLNTHGNVVRAGEEILSEYWYSTDATVPVGIRMLAAYHQQRSTTNSNIKWFAAGSSTANTLFKHLASDGQTLLPRRDSGGNAYAEFTTTAKFYLRVDSDYSVDSMNTNAANPAAFPIVDGGHAMRFYAAKDPAGKIIPGTYILIMDYVGQSYSNYDYQDNIYLITGVKPASGPLAPTGLTLATGGSGNTLNWAAGTEGNLAGYNVYRSTSANGTFAKLNGNVLTARTLLDDTADAGVTYFYRVVAVDYQGTESTTPSTISGSRGADTVAPAAPSTVTAVGSETSITLGWLDNVESDLAGYNVYRASSLDGTYVKLNSGLLTQSDYADLAAPVGATSYYRITAVDATGNESVAATGYAFRAASGAVPTAPSSLAAAPSTASVKLTWADNASDETGYLIERQNADGSYSQVGTAGANATTYTDSGLTSGQTYVYRVRAQNSFGPSGYSNVVTSTTTLVAPTAPGGLVATALTANAVKLTWTDGSTNETGFRIDRKLASATTWTTIDTVGANVISYVDASALAATGYTYRVVAFNNAGTATSGTANVTTPSAVGYTSVDIGSPSAAGATTAVAEGKDYDIKAGGSDVWGTNDQFRYVYRQVAGDFDYSARITELNQADVGSMVGLMARESLNADSKHIYMRARPNAAGGLRANYRDANGGASGSTGNAATNFPNVWVRLQRVGNTFNAYGSSDGQTWTLMLSRSMSMGSTVYLGIAASARTTSTATMTTKVRDLTDRNASVAPTAPDQLVGTADANGSKVTLYWRDNSANETGFRVERRLVSSDTWAAIGTVGANVITYVDSAVSAGNSYVYRVVALNGAGSSAATAELTLDVVSAAPTVPAAPQSLAASNATGGNVALAWTDASSNETNFAVERSVSGSGTWTTLSASVAANATTYTDATAAAGTSYIYRVRAINSAGNSAYSNDATVTTPAAPVTPSLTSADIGTTGGSTTVVTEGSAYTVTGGGADIYGTSDEFRFVYKQLTGDFDVKVRVSALTYQVAGTMAGLMARATLDADSRHVYVKTRADGTTNWAVRATTAGTTTASSSTATPFPNAWIRMARVGNTFTMYTSADGVTWTQLAQTTQSLPTTLYVGLAVSAHQAGATTTATYDNLTFA